MTGKRLKLTSFGVIVALLASPVFAAGNLRVTRMTEAELQQSLKYECAYPHVEGIQDSSRQQRINVRMRERARTAKEAAELTARLSPEAGLSGQYDFEVKRNEGGILSIVFVNTLTKSGRTAQQYDSVTLNTVSGETYGLGDLFNQNADYVGMLSERIRRQITQKGLASKLKHPFKNIRISEDYYLTNEDLVILMGQDYFPDESKVQEFHVALKSLEGSLKPSLRLST